MASLPNLRRGRRARVDPRSAPPAEPRSAPSIQRLEHGRLTWLNIEAPTELETDWLAEHYEFHELDLEDVRSRRRQRAKIDEYSSYLFIVLHFPRFDKRVGRLQAAELNLFVAEDLVITLPNEQLKPLSGLWSRCEARPDVREAVMSKGSGYLLYEIVDSMFDYCFPILDKIGFKLDSLEDQVFEGERSESIVRDISNVKQEIINYRKTIKPQRPTLRMLERVSQRYAPEDLELYFDDIVDKNERIWDSLENYKEVVEAIEASNEAVISHRLNDVIRALTILSAITLPLTLVTGVYGMNLETLPLARHGIWSFLMVLGIMAAIGGGLIWFFRRKKWL